MGLQLKDVPSNDVCGEDLHGRRVAIDVPNLAYAFYSTLMINAPDAREEAVLAAARGVVARVLDLAEHGAKSVLIFDGSPHHLKRDTLHEREASRRFPRLTGPDLDTIRAAARPLGVPVVDAPHDAEAQAAWMQAEELVDVVATTDWDVLAMGADVVLRGLSKKSDGWKIVRAGAALRALDLPDADRLAVAAVLMGCDYSPGIKGVGPKKAFAIARTCGWPPHFDFPIQDPLPKFDDSLRAFTEPAHVDVELQWAAPRREEAFAALVRLGFILNGATRLRLASLDAVHRAGATISTPTNAQASLGAWTP